MTALLIAALAFALRAAPRLIRRHAISSDGYFHLLMARAIRQEKHRIPPVIPRALASHRFTYPFLYHWLLSFVPERSIPVAERYSSAFVDALLVLGSYELSRRIAGQCMGVLQADEIAAWTALALAVSPALLRVSGGPRAYNGSPRPLGQLMFLAFMGGQILYDLEAEPIWLILSTLAIVPLSISSKFANQVVVITSIMLAVAGKFAILPSALAGYVLAGAVTRGAAWRVLRGQLGHSLFYRKHVQREYLAGRSLVHYVRSFLRSCYISLRRPWQLILWFFRESHPVHLIVSAFPHLLLLAYVLYWSGTQSPIGNDDIASALLPWCLAALASTAIITLPWFLFLGEAERYLEYTLFPQMLLFVLVVFGTGRMQLLQGFVVYSLAAYVFFFVIYVKGFTYWQSVWERFLPLVRKFDREGARLYSLGTLFWPLLYGTEQAQVLCLGVDNDERLLSHREWLSIAGNYPYPGTPIEELVKTYKVDYIASSRQAVQEYEECLGDSAFSDGRFHLVDEAGPFVVYATASSRGAMGEV